MGKITSIGEYSPGDPVWKEGWHIGVPLKGKKAKPKATGKVPVKGHVAPNPHHRGSHYVPPHARERPKD